VSMARREPGAGNDTDALGLASQFRYRHHAMVLGCRLPEHMSRLPSWRLGVSASGGGEAALYERSRIPVNRGSVLRPGGEMALCTMINKVTELLRPWAKFHASLGFEQILVYVEANDTSAVEENLRDLLDRGRVTIVPFYFGAVSDMGQFHLQAAMEQHCLYQARGRVTWLGHADEDEFFDLRVDRSGGLRSFLQRLPSKAAAVSVRSQRWRPASHTEPGSISFPCFVACKRSGYNAPGRATKWIARPEQVSISNPHVVESAGLVYTADPEEELRLNHFRRIKSNMTSEKDVGCSKDLSFQHHCDALIKAPLPPHQAA